jgi:hypothetical protein
MRATERIKLKTEIIARLQDGTGWDMLESNLEEFGIFMSHANFGRMDQYLIHALRGISDQTLSELAEHVGLSLLSGEITDKPSYWREGDFRVFLSHLAKFKQEASEIQAELDNYGCSSFVAHEDIQVSKEWQNEIELALQTSDCLVALLRPGFHESAWTDQEIGWMLGRKMPTIAVRLGTDPYGFIGSLQAMQGQSKSPKEIGSELLRVFLSNEVTAPKMTRCLIDKFVTSGSYLQTLGLMKSIETITYWEKAFEELLNSALKTNPQIFNAHNVRFRVKALIDSHSKAATN